MIDLTSLPPEELGQTQRSIQQEIIRRGWQASIAYQGSAHYFITRDDGKKLRIFSSTPPTSSYAAASLVNDKFATHSLLQESNIPQLETVKVSGHGEPKLEIATELIERVGKVVVKPIDGGHGKGITTGVVDAQALEPAVALAISHTKNVHAALVQQHYPHDTIYDLRILCINYEYIGTIWRMPARVYGDGVHTVRKLIELENQKPDRGKPYYARLATIDEKKAVEYLGEKADDVPAMGEEVAVLGIANYGAGGETIDATDDIPQWLIDEAIVVSRACELPVAGVDFMIAQPPRKDATREELDPMVTEVNKAPHLGIHDAPTTGTPRPATVRYMDYLASL